MVHEVFTSVDPGNNCGVAHWRNRELTAAYLIKGREQALYQFRTAHNRGGPLVIEMPQSYVGRRSKGKGGDIVELAKFVGQVSAAFGSEVTFVLPAQWKGNLPKKICKLRCAVELTPEEHTCVTTEDHNVWDAIGIGLWYLGRLKKRGKR